MKTTFTIKNFLKGQNIFKEDYPGEKAYIIKSGKVEISKKIGTENITLATIGDGAIFGEMALLNNFKRTASAQAVEYTELVEIERDQYLSLLKTSPPIITKIISSLIHKLSETTQRIPLQKTDNPFISICRIIYLLGKSSPGYHAGKKDKTSINYYDALRTIEDIISIPTFELETLIKKMGSIDLLKIEDISSSEKSIVINDIDNFLNHSKKIYEEFKESFSINFLQEKDLIQLGDLAKIANIPGDLILKKIGWGEVKESLFFFHKNEVMKWITQQGTDAFDKGKILRKNIEKMDKINDIIYVDNETIQTILGEMDVIQICKILKDASEQTRNKIFNNLSTRIQNVVKETLPELKDIDPIEVADTEEMIITKIKALKSKQKGVNP